MSRSRLARDFWQRAEDFAEEVVSRVVLHAAQVSHLIRGSQAVHGVECLVVGFVHADSGVLLRVHFRLNRTAFVNQSIKIKGDLIPEAAAEEIIGELQALFARHNAGAALSAKAVFKPTKEFHTVRHTLYSADDNMEIDKVVPVAASVKTKLGRGRRTGVSTLHRILPIRL
ncbi:MAG: hypothetical protein D4R65_13925 [Verrucomicrobiaceae bacterium]|nr:MAG: hypothetical protein D4R65_13925 [Verrucomicrobiaceae bacterium]